MLSRKSVKFCLGIMASKFGNMLNNQIAKCLNRYVTIQKRSVSWQNMTVPIDWNFLDSLYSSFFLSYTHIYWTSSTIFM